jgi:ribulose 1,5-bisphosphate carboxylase large subunit-like protein
MPDADGTTNSQVVDATTIVDTLVTGLTPGASFALLDAVMTETIGMAMQNAVTRQQSAGMISTAAVSAVCARIAGVVPPPPPPPPSIPPLPPQPEPGS